MQYSSVDFPRIVTTRSCTITFEGSTLTIKSDDPAYDTLIKAIGDEDWDALPSLMSPATAVKNLSDGRLRVDGGQVYLTDEDGNEFEVPGSLNDCIILHIDKNLDLGGLVNFAVNLQDNPSRRSVQQLFGWLETANLTITDDGHFLAYKAVKEDFTDCHTGTVDNSPGQRVRIARNRVDDDPTRHCSHGFHVAAWDYVATGPMQGDKIVQVKVNPRDVVAVPTDYNSTKMRVHDYLVMKEVDKPVREPLYVEPSEDSDSGSDYYDDYDDDDDDDDGWL
jgi:hypothetical protein